MSTGRDCLIPDDMIDTAGTVTEAARALKKLGANDIYVCATHALLSGPAVDRLSAAPIKEVVVTDTIAVPPERRFAALKVLSVGELLAKAIRFTHSDQIGQLAVRLDGAQFHLSCPRVFRRDPVMASATLSATLRSDTGKGAARKLRQSRRNSGRHLRSRPRAAVAHGQRPRVRPSPQVRRVRQHGHRARHRWHAG